MQVEHPTQPRQAAAPDVVTVSIGDDGGDGGELYMCQMCGFIYDPAEGDELGEIPPGTRFADLPADWTCPVCGSQKSDFEPMDA